MSVYLNPRYDTVACFVFHSLLSCFSLSLANRPGRSARIGNQDVNDLMNSVLLRFGGGDTLPTVQGNMTCSKENAGTAKVEWKIYGED